MLPFGPRPREGATHKTPGREIYTSEYGVVTIVTDAIQHVYGEWASNNDGTHSRVCDCGDTQTENCVYNQKVDAPAFLKSAATCTSKAVYYLSCVCGAHSAEATFESGTALGHDYTNFQVKSEPTCTEAGQVVADCTRCDQNMTEQSPHSDTISRVTAFLMRKQSAGATKVARNMTEANITCINARVVTQ